MSLTVLVLLALAAYRVTRLIVIDALFDSPRNTLYDFLQPKGWLGDKLSYLISCTWCAGVWVSAGIYWLYANDFVFLDVAALAGLQGLLHAFEPDAD